MRKHTNNIINIVLPNKKINILVICIIILGLIFGSVFANIIGIKDQNVVI